VQIRGSKAFLVSIDSSLVPLMFSVVFPSRLRPQASPGRSGTKWDRVGQNRDKAGQNGTRRDKMGRNGTEKTFVLACDNGPKNAKRPCGYRFFRQFSASGRSIHPQSPAYGLSDCGAACPISIGLSASPRPLTAHSVLVARGYAGPGRELKWAARRAASVRSAGLA